MPYNAAYIKAKIQKAANRMGMAAVKPISSDRLPPGQYLTQQFPILDLGVRVPLELTDFTLKISGKVEHSKTLSYSEFIALGSQSVIKDFHCVTSWSKFDIPWKGVPFEAIYNLAKPVKAVKHVIFSSRDGYTTNVALEECLTKDVIFAYELDGSEIPLIHGGPVRVIVPYLYGWKSAKFVSEVTFVEHDAPGYWEVRGYNNHADPWKEERYS